MKEGFTATGLYEVVAEAGNGDELVELFKAPSFSMPEMVLSDMNMPGKNGYDVLRDVRSNGLLPQVPVIILSVAPSVPYGEKCRQLGACAYFTKPDTFLDYPVFAQQIYDRVRKGCLKD